MNYTQKIDFSPGSEARLKIRKEFDSPRWEPFKTWFLANFDDHMKYYISELFYKHLSFHNILFPFVPWFMDTYIDPYITVLERDYKLLNGNILKGVWPPQQPFHLEKDNHVVSFTAFVKLFENDTLQITEGVTKE